MERRRLSLPGAFLRLEGAVLLALAVFAYQRHGQSWWLFALLILAPDLGALGYFGGPVLGAVTYNCLHTYLGPAVVTAIGVASDTPPVVSVGLIWFAHIGADRLVGYGLKYPASFKETHLQRV